jgi:ComF family protein
MWSKDICETCAEKLSEFRCNDSTDITAAYYYRGSVIDGIYALKFTGAKNFAKHSAKIISDRIDGNFDIIVPVPIGKKRLRKRGYNQAEVFAEYFSLYMQIPIEKNALIRTNETIQHRLTQKERMKNAEDSYHIGYKSVTGKRILLVDDVSTTGATLSVCKKRLLDAGAVDVKTAVCAKTNILQNNRSSSWI